MYRSFISVLCATLFPDKSLIYSIQYVAVMAGNPTNKPNHTIQIGNSVNIIILVSNGIVSRYYFIE